MNLGTHMEITVATSETATLCYPTVSQHNLATDIALGFGGLLYFQTIAAASSFVLAHVA